MQRLVGEATSQPGFVAQGNHRNQRKIQPVVEEIGYTYYILKPAMGKLNANALPSRGGYGFLQGIDGNQLLGEEKLDVLLDDGQIFDVCRPQ